MRDSVDEALLDNFFDRSSYLYEEPGNLLKQELREPAIYNAIIKAIAEGASRMNDINNNNWNNYQHPCHHLLTDFSPWH